MFGVIFLGGDAAYVEFVASYGEFDLFGAFGSARALFGGEAVVAFGAADAFFVVFGEFVFGA